MKGKRKWILWITVAIVVILIIRIWIFPRVFPYAAYYKFDANGFRVTKAHFKPYRRDYLIQIQEDIVFRIGSHCIEQGLHSDKRACKIDIRLDNTDLTETNISFEDISKFKVEGVRGLNDSFNIDLEVDGFNNWAWIHLHLEEGTEPRKIRIYLPETTIDGQPLELPVITGKHKRDFYFIPSF